MPIGGDEAEWPTRKQRIDTKLRALNPKWQIIRYHDGLDLSRLTCHVVEELPTENGPADYGFFVNGIFLGITEAKKVSVNPQNVLEQTKRYSSGVFFRPCGARSSLHLQPTVGTVDYGRSSLTGLWNPCSFVSSVVKQKIVRLEELSALADPLEPRLAKARGRARELDTSSDLWPPSPRSRRRRAAPFTRAFAGKVLPQNPTDEPVSELLKRIQTKGTSHAT
jgi:hypothetical protein